MSALTKLKEKLSVLARDPICDIEETKSHTLLSFDLPNLKSDDFDISVDGKTLLVSVKRHHTCPTETGTTTVLKCHHQNFLREFSFPILLNPKNIDAYYSNGVLRIAVPKNALVLKQKVPISTSPSGVFASNKSNERTEPIESFSDIDDYDWE
jgi:HSP20 family protein